MTVRLCSFISILTLYLLLSPGWAHPADAVKEVYIEDTAPPIATPKYSPDLEEFDPPLGKYTFSITWGIVHAGKATVAVERDEESYQIRVKAKSRDMVDTFYKLRYRGEAHLSAKDLSPIKTYLVERKKNKKKKTEITFHGEGEIESVRHKYKDGTKRKSEFRSLATQNYTLDPFSAVFVARSLDWAQGESALFDVFTGTDRYLLTLNCLGKETIEVLGQKREVWLLVPTAQNITEDEEASHIEGIRIYLSTDKAKELLVVEGDIPVGTIVTKLESFEPSNTKNDSPGTHDSQSE
jgi:hypothetical protein